MGYNQTYGQGLGGLNSGQYRTTIAPTSGSTINATYSTNVGTGIALTSIAHPEPTIGPPTYDDTPRIRTGEITAVRIWEIEDGLLRSVYMHHVWKPGIVEHAPVVKPGWGEGLHAFKTLDHAKKEYKGWGNYVYGEVALWGDVVEFEHGWKAEYAKITKIYLSGFLIRRLEILRLRKKYGV